MIKKSFSIFPENLKKYKNLEASTKSFVKVLDEKISSEILNLNFYKNLEDQKDIILDELAWHWNVEFYSSELPKSKKVELIKMSYLHHRKKGTAGVLESALKIIIGDIKVVEFDEYNGIPFTFRIISAENIPPTGDLTEMKNIINIFKNVRSSLDKILFIKENNGALRAYGGIHSASRKIDYPRKES